MATYTRVSGDYNIVSIDPTVDNVNVTTSSLNINGNLNVAGNITYITVESFTVDDPFITIAGNNSGTLGTAPYQEQGIVTRTSGSTYAGIRFDNGTQEWQISDDVYANGAPVTAYVAISTYANADVAAYLPTYTGNISAGNVSVTGNISAGNVSVTGNISAGNVSVTGNISAGNLDAINLVINNISSDDSTFVTIEDGLNVNGEISTTGNITVGNLNSNAAVTGSSGVFSGVVSGTLNAIGNANVGNLGTSGLVVATGNITAGNVSTAGNISGNTNGFTIGYLNIPQVSFAGDVTIATTDAGKHYYSTLSTGNVLTIANNASQSFQVGAAISVVNQGTGNITVAQDSGVTLYLAGNATSGNRTVATFGMATLIKVATDTWFINGTGVS
jgi:hypothetical protein